MSSNIAYTCQEGSQGGANDVFSGVATGPDGSIVLAGYTDGSWDAPSKGGTDFAAVNLDAEGAVLWRWQVTREPPHPVSACVYPGRQDGRMLSA